MAFHYKSVTIGAAVTPIVTTANRTPAYQVIIQNNAGHDIRVGDSTASVSGNVGYLLKTNGTPPNTLVLGAQLALSLGLEQIFISGAQNDVIDVLYIK